MGNMLYVMYTGYEEATVFAWLLKTVTFWIYLLLITIFAAVDFESATVPTYSSRNSTTFDSSFGLFCFIWCYLAGSISQCVSCCVLWIVTDSPDKDTTRDVFLYLQGKQWNEAMQLLEFGVTRVEGTDGYGNVEFNLLSRICNRRRNKINRMRCTGWQKARMLQ